MEAAAGVVLIASGIGAPLGALLVAYGADLTASGIMQIAKGEQVETLTYKGIFQGSKKLGASDKTAGAIAGGSELVIGLGSTLPSLIRGVRRVFTKSSAKNVGSVAETSTQSFKSFSDLKKALGPEGKNRHWHHIVEQHADNAAKFGQGSIQNTKNVISIPGGVKGSLHGKVTGHYNSLMPGTSMRVRDYVKTLTYDQQYEYGIDVLKRFGWTP